LDTFHRGSDLLMELDTYVNESLDL